MTRLLTVLPLVLAADAFAAPLIPGSLSFEASMPGTVDPQSIVLGASGRLTLSDRVIAIGDLTSTGDQLTRIGTDCNIDGDIYTVPDVRVADRTVFDELEHEGATDIANTAVFNRSVQVDFGDDTLIRLDYTVPDVSAGNLQLNPDQTGDWIEERYDRVNVFSRSTLTLTAGTWYVDHLSVEPQGKIVLDDSAGPITLVVGESLNFRGDWVDGTDDGFSPFLLIAYDGTRELLLDRAYQGFVVAPHATISLSGNNNLHEGAFLGLNIMVRPGNAVLQRPFNSFGAENPCPDGLVPLFPFRPTLIRGIEPGTLDVINASDLGSMFKPDFPLCVVPL